MKSPKSGIAVVCPLTDHSDRQILPEPLSPTSCSAGTHQPELWLLNPNAYKRYYILTIMCHTTIIILAEEPISSAGGSTPNYNSKQSISRHIK
jgi:hypothetical protein